MKIQLCDGDSVKLKRLVLTTPVFGNILKGRAFTLLVDSSRRFVACSSSDLKLHTSVYDGQAAGRCQVLLYWPGLVLSLPTHENTFQFHAASTHAFLFTTSTISPSPYHSASLRNLENLEDVNNTVLQCFTVEVTPYARIIGWCIRFKLQMLCPQEDE